jgi:hypothetical protein
MIYKQLDSITFVYVLFIFAGFYSDNVICVGEEYIVTCSGTGDAFRFVTSFIYDFTSRHYNYILFTMCSDPLTLRLWSAPLFCSCFYSFPPRNRVLAPRIEDILSYGYFWSVGQVFVTGTSVNIRCSANNCSPSRWLAMLTSVLVK